ncbi:MAG: hypothetical protein PF638_13245 [Candidatus Delongbacteria bacterium]|jgi:hypothetical protein|nr:hypothetical protein [Candidatus Delongbacteria bacterium]
MVKLSDNRIVASTWSQKYQEDNSIEVKINILLMDENFTEIKTIDKIHEIVNNSVAVESQFYPFICGNNEELYITWISTDEYKINVYHSNTGDKKYQIKKDYKTFYYSDIEMDRMSEQNKVDMKKIYGNIKKRAINEIFMDKYNRLWVLSTKERNSGNLLDMYADIFLEGIYQNTFHFKDLVYIVSI